MKKGHVAAYLLVLGFFLLPVFAHAALVPACEGPTCRFGDFIQLLQNIIRFLLMIAVPLFAILFSWAGLLMVTASGNMTQINKAKGIMTTAFIGFGIALAAYLFINLLTTVFLKGSPNAHDIFKGTRTLTSYEIV